MQTKKNKIGFSGVYSIASLNVVFLAGRAQRDRREMISREIFSVANMASGVFFVVASFPDFFSQF